MNKENKKSKKTLIALIAIALAVVIAVVITTIAVSVGNNNDVIDDSSGPSTPADPSDPADPSKPSDPADPPNLPSDPDDETTSGAISYGSPLISYTLGQEFNVSEMVWSNTLKWYSTHNGTDFKTDKGAVVSAIYGGTVDSIAYTTQYGYVITVNQTDGYTAQYMSLSNDIFVEEGDSVSKGTQLGYVSDSMSNEQNDGAHLHLEITDANGDFVDPMSLISPSEEK